MIIQTETKYICECCGDSLRTKEICEEHEVECKKDREEKLSYKERVRQLSNNEYIFYGKSKEDIQDCVAYNSMGYLDDYTYENFEYPCFVLLSKYSKPEPYENYDTNYVNIRLLDEYIKKIEEIKIELNKENK